MTDAMRLTLRPDEAARALGVSPRTLFTWTKSGDIPSIKVGSCVLYRVVDIERWLADLIKQEVAP